MNHSGVLSANHSGVGRGGVLMESLDGRVTTGEMAEGGGSLGWGDGWMTGGVADVLGVGFALHGGIRITKWLQ